LSIAFLIGFIIPLAIVYLRMILKTKVQAPEDITTRTRLPLIGVVPKSPTSRLISVNKGDDEHHHSNDNPLDEIYRSIRTNVGFMSGKVIQVSSSVPN
jgi:hypothetical protein